MEIPPRLAHLRTDRRGIPVPYVNRWGPDDENRLRLGYDRSCKDLAIFQDDDDQEVPDFTAQNIGRQRECMVAGLCQVCARFVPWSRRYLVVSSISVERVRVPLRGEVMVVTEPWLCGYCAMFAIERCPALIRRKTAADLSLVAIRSKLDAEMVVSRGWVDGPLREQTLHMRPPPLMWAKIHLSMLRITTE